MAYSYISFMPAIAGHLLPMTQAINNLKFICSINIAVLQKESLNSFQLKEQTYPDKSSDALDAWVQESEDSLTFHNETLQQIGGGR